MGRPAPSGGSPTGSAAFRWCLVGVAILLGGCSLAAPRPAGPMPADVARLIAAANAQVGVTLYYDPSYVRLSYPGGDVPMERGVCTDVVVRAFRAVGQDLQRLVHEDLRGHFAAYPRLWGLTRADANIDHRRVPNLETFFRRRGATRPTSAQAEDYWPGDLVSWRLDDGRPHIGLVSDVPASGSPRLLMIHNIGQGAQREDVLFAWKIAGHFRVLPWPSSPSP